MIWKLQEFVGEFTPIKWNILDNFFEIQSSDIKESAILSYSLVSSRLQIGHSSPTTAHHNLCNYGILYYCTPYIFVAMVSSTIWATRKAAKSIIDRFNCIIPDDTFIQNFYFVKVFLVLMS